VLSANSDTVVGNVLELIALTVSLDLQVERIAYTKYHMRFPFLDYQFL